MKDKYFEPKKFVKNYIYAITIFITSSEISISLTIEKKDKVKAVQTLGKAFDL